MAKIRYILKIRESEEIYKKFTIRKCEEAPAD